MADCPRAVTRQRSGRGTFDIGRVLRANVGEPEQGTGGVCGVIDNRWASRHLGAFIIGVRYIPNDRMDNIQGFVFRTKIEIVKKNLFEGILIF